MKEMYIVATASILIGLILGIIAERLFIFAKVDAIMHVRQGDPETDRFNLIVLCPLDDISKKKHMIVEVKATE